MPMRIEGPREAYAEAYTLSGDLAIAGGPERTSCYLADNT
jgi:hypothetical protein